MKKGMHTPHRSYHRQRHAQAPRASSLPRVAHAMCDKPNLDAP